MARPSSRCAERATVAALALALGTSAAAVGAQASPAAPSTLTPKRTLTLGPAPGCEAAPAPRLDARRDNAEARRLAAAGQEAALVGDVAAAREAFAKAAELNPTDERVAYDLARAHEELADTAKAVGEYCRYLVLAPSGREVADARTRVRGLVAAEVVLAAEAVDAAFRAGLEQFDAGRYLAASQSFDEVVQRLPTAIEGTYNRGLARAGAGRRSEAIADLEAFRAASASLDDRVRVGRALEVLRRPVYDPAQAFGRSLLPGFGQVYTGRPVLGVLVLATVSSAAAMAVYQRTTEREVAYTDPNGAPAPYVERVTERPYLTTGAAAAVGFAVTAMFEAVLEANRSRRGASIIGRASRASAPLRPAGGVAITPMVTRDGGAGLAVRARF